MPTFKHPCPACGRYIQRDVSRCPYCAAVDPFAPGRCAACRTPVEDLAWVACPSCGAPLKDGVVPMPGATPGTEPAGGPRDEPAPAPAPAQVHVPPVMPQPAASAAPAPASGGVSDHLPERAGSPPGGDICAACAAPLAAGARFCTVCGTLAG